MSNNETNWLNELKTGDMVVVNGRYGQRLSTITTTTKTYVFVKVNEHYSAKYRRSNGEAVEKQPYYTEMLLEATPAMVTSIHQKQVHAANIRVVANMDLDGLSRDQIARIAAIIQEGK